MLIAISLVDLGAFIALALATAVITAHLVGLATWLRDRPAEERDHAGL